MAFNVIVAQFSFHLFSGKILKIKMLLIEKIKPDFKKEKVRVGDLNSKHFIRNTKKCQLKCCTTRLLTSPTYLNATEGHLLIFF